MSKEDFLGHLARTLMLGAALGVGLWLAFGARWMSFYGLATVALATLPFVTRHLWRRLPAAGRSRWWTLAVTLPAAILALLQIGYWVMFFATGPTNPSLGVVREMLRPILTAAEPWAIAGLAVLWGFVFAQALTEPHAAPRRAV